MDSSRELFLAGGTEISRRGGDMAAAPAVQKQSPDAKQHRSFYGSRLFSSNNGRGKKAAQVDLQSLTKLVDDPQLHGRVCAIHKITDGGLRYAAFHIELILRHAALLHQLEPNAC